MMQSVRVGDPPLVEMEEDDWEALLRACPPLALQRVAKRFLQAFRINDPWYLAAYEIGFLFRVIGNAAGLLDNPGRKETRNLFSLEKQKIGYDEALYLFGLSQGRLASNYILRGKYAEFFYSDNRNSLCAVLSLIAEMPLGGEYLAEPEAPSPQPSKEPTVRMAPPLSPLTVKVRTARPTGAVSEAERLVAQERANAEHQRALETLTVYLHRQGRECECSSLIDATVKVNSERMIFEVKSIADDGKNEVDQVRAAFAQLFDYRFRYQGVAGFSSMSLWVLLSCPPRLDWTFGFLQHHDVRLLWIDAGEVQGTDLPHLFPQAP